MPIPGFQSIALPLLQYIGKNDERSLRQCIDEMAEHFNLNDNEKTELLPSGTQAIFDNRVSWSKTHLLKACLLESPRRSIVRITERGREVLQAKPEKITVSYLKQFKEYLDFVRPVNDGVESENAVSIDQSQSTPEEILEESYQSIRRSLAYDLLTRIKMGTPSFFEKLVVELLVKMGYGGSVKDAGKATRISKDGGIDGIIKEDKLGLDVIYIQAKKWTDGPVGRPEVQGFVGALDGHRANKGVFITTSKFTDTAIEYIKTISKKVILIDGEQLAGFMIDYGLGVSTTALYELKKMDGDYFGE